MSGGIGPVIVGWNLCSYYSVCVDIRGCSPRHCGVESLLRSQCVWMSGGIASVILGWNLCSYHSLCVDFRWRSPQSSWGGISAPIKVCVDVRWCSLRHRGVESLLLSQCVCGCQVAELLDLMCESSERRDIAGATSQLYVMHLLFLF